jgi:hypothetical protein
MEVQQEIQQWARQSVPAKPALQSVDLRSTGKLRAPENQGNCGSAAAFSTTHTWQDYFTSRGCGYPRLAVQHPVNCAISCSGGYPSTIYNWIQSTGITTESCLAYKAVKGTCGNACDGTSSTCGGQATITQRLKTYYACTTQVPTIMAWLDAGYPVSTAMQIQYKFYDHASATVATNSVYPRSTGNSAVAGYHAIEIVGYGTLAGTDYWIVKNTWGSTWGDSGYLKVAKGVDQGGIETAFGNCRPTATSCPSLSSSGGFDTQSFQLLGPENVPGGEYNSSTPPLAEGTAAPGGQVPAPHANELLSEATVFAIHVLESTPDYQGGFGCLPALPSRIDQNISGTAMERMEAIAEMQQGNNVISIVSADQQVIQGVGYHFIFSFSSNLPQCKGAAGTFDATVHVTSDGYLIMQNVFKTNPPAAESSINMTAVIAGSVAAGAVVLLAFTYCGYRHHKSRKTINRLTEVQKDVFHRLSMIEASDPTVARIGLSRALEDTDLASPPAKPQNATSPNWHPLKNTTRV